jgi:uncharacterized protein
MPLWMSILAGGVATYVAVAGFLYAMQTRMIFPAQVGYWETARGTLMNLTMADGVTLRGQVVAGDPQTLVIAYPGNAQDSAALAHDLHQLTGATVAAFAYRGYPSGAGRSDGTPGGKELAADGAAVASELKRRLQPKRLVLVGYSLGSHPATAAASTVAADALILLAPFASMRQLAGEKYPWLPVGLLLKHPMDTKALLQQLPAATDLTIFAGEQDTLVPPHHARQLASLRTGSKLQMLAAGTHDNLLGLPEVRAELGRSILPPQAAR